MGFKQLLQLKALEEIDFPRFPLYITKDKAEEVAEKISNTHWDDYRKEKLASGLQSMFSFLTKHYAVSNLISAEFFSNNAYL